MVILERAALEGRFSFLANLIDRVDGIEEALIDKTQELFLDFMVRLGAQGNPTYTSVLDALVSDPTNNDSLFLERLLKRLQSDSRYPKVAKDACGFCVGESRSISLQDPRTIGLSALEHYFICPDDKRGIPQPSARSSRCPIIFL